MRRPRADLARSRRDQIVDAAVAVIAEQGLQNLSLSAIEQRVGMSRGQLTYYFRAKEDILLAVFDRLLQLMCQRAAPDGDESAYDRLSWLEVIRRLLEFLLQDPPAHPEFHALQHTFLSQISHRADFRERLANLYATWRGHSAAHLERDLHHRPAARPVSPRALATLTQAILHGLAVQAAADPNAIDRDEMIRLTLDLLGSYLWTADAALDKPGPLLTVSEVEHESSRP